MHEAIIVGVIPVWLFVACKTGAALRKPNRNLGFLWLAALLAACAFSLRIPLLYALVSDTVRVENISRVFINLAMVGSMASAVRFLDGVDRRPHISRAPYLIALSVGLLLIICFPFEHLTGPDRSMGFIELYGGNPAVFISRGAYMAFLAGSGVFISRRFWSIATHIHPAKGTESIAIGIYMLCIGALLVAVYATEEVVRIVSRFVWSNPLTFLHTPFFTLFLAGILTMLAGGICRVWGDRLGVGRVYWWGWHKLSWHRLRPLSIGVRQAGACYWIEPQVPLWREWLTVRDVRRLHLSRQFDAIDGWSRARGYADSLAGDLVRNECIVGGIPESRIDMEANAANFRCALEAMSQRLSPFGKPRIPLYLDSDWEPSSAYFQSLSRVYDSPRVRRAVERTLAIRRSQPR